MNRTIITGLAAIVSLTALSGCVTYQPNGNAYVVPETRPKELRGETPDAFQRALKEPYHSRDYHGSLPHKR